MPWPAGLPPLTITDDYTETIPEGYFESQNDGPKKRRPKPTADNTPLTFTQYYDATQKALLENFYRTTLSGGALPFTDFLPVSGEVATLQFRGPITFGHLGGNEYRASFQLEVLP